MIDSLPLITVGITAFNEGEMLLESWNSILNQTSKNWNAVLVLDGDANKKTKKFFNLIDHKNLYKYYFSKNQGAYKCRSKAITLSKTEWYFQLDADDYLPPNAIKILTEAININPDIEFIAGACKHFNLGRDNIVLPSSNIESLTISPLFFAQAPIKKSLFMRLGGFYIPDFFLHSDWDFWLSVYELDIKGIYLNDILYCRRRRKNSLTKQHIEGLSRALDCILERHPQFFNSENRINRAKYNVYHNNARYYKSIGKRFIAKKYADCCLKFGPISPSIKAIEQEAEMSTVRFFFRRLGKLL